MHNANLRIFHKKWKTNQVNFDKKENPISGDTGFFHNIENEQKNYLVITTKYLVTLQNNSGFVICNTN